MCIPNLQGSSSILYITVATLTKDIALFGWVHDDYLLLYICECSLSAFQGLVKLLRNH